MLLFFFSVLRQISETYNVIAVLSSASPRGVDVNWGFARVMEDDKKILVL